MKKFVLDLTTWEINIPIQKADENGKPFIVQEKMEYPLKDNLGSMLRAGGLFDNTEDTVEAIMLGKNIRSCMEHNIEIDERELELLKKCMDRHLDAATKGQGTFGGEQHEKLILRIHTLWKNKNAEGE
jgi:hypothetical protein